MSRPQVTITLGRSGQVVKRAESSSTTNCEDYVPSSGTKRSVKDRLGINADTFDDLQVSKRQRRDDNRSLGDDDVDGARVNQNDLRYKLIRKKMSRIGEERRNKIDLREKLSRAAQPPMKTDTRQRMPEIRSIDTQQRMPERRVTDTRHRMPEPTDMVRRAPPRNEDDLLQMESLRKTYSGWTYDGLRSRSPDRMSTRGRSPPRPKSPPRPRSPPRPMEVRRPVGQISSLTHVDSSRPISYASKDIFDPSRPTSFMSKTSVPLEAPAVRLPPPSAPGSIPKVSYVGEEVTVSSLLHSLGLGKYAIIFQAEEVDMHALKQMGDSDLKELGIPMGPRKKILLSVAGRARRQP